ncbi:MAG: hypothetical protein LBU76_10910 [Azoarcus sp.]|nr:hypothetical protein [Azoarcus sp.]
MFAQDFVDKFGFEVDLDLDGIPDKVDVARATSDEIGDGSFTRYNLRIDFSSGVPAVNATLHAAEPYESTISSLRNKPGYLLLYIGKLDYAYAVYKWDISLEKMCLHATATGINDYIEKRSKYDKFVKLYNKCIDFNVIIPKPDFGFGETDYDYYNKNIIQTEIVTDKADLFDSPDKSSKSGMYLVKGDVVIVKEYKYRVDKKENEIGWFRVQYFSKKLNRNITKWLLSTSFDTL